VTVLERRILRRLLATAPLCALTACATTGTTASQAEVTELKAQVRALRDTQSRLEKRLERLELHQSVRQSSTAPAQAASAAAKTPEVPDLTVVKLKPRVEPAPPLPTAVPIVEPSSEDMEAFVAVSDGDSGGRASRQTADEEPTAQAEPGVLDAEFEQAVAALRTGNVEGGVQRLQRFAEENPRHPRADNALYFSGLGLMGQKDHKAAIRSFEQLIEQYPAGDAVLDGMLRLAECRVRLDQREDARALYTRILTQFPGTAAATQAEQRLASLSP
jgi:tol-pal system protein YbgF